MKKFFLFLFLVFFLVSTVSSVSNTWSFEKRYSYDSVVSYAKISGAYPFCDRVKIGNSSVCLDYWYVDFSFVGDSFVIQENAVDWISADENGFSSGVLISSGRYYFYGDQVPRFIVCSWDRNSRGSSWSYAYICGGYLGSANLPLYHETYVSPSFICGNNVCESGESISSCPADCGSSNISTKTYFSFFSWIVNFLKHLFSNVGSVGSLPSPSFVSHVSGGGY